MIRSQIRLKRRIILIHLLHHKSWPPNPVETKTDPARSYELTNFLALPSPGLARRRPAFSPGVLYKQITSDLDEETPMDFDDDSHRRKWVLDASVKIASALSINGGIDRHESPRALASIAVEVAESLWDLSEFA